MVVFLRAAALRLLLSQVAELYQGLSGCDCLKSPTGIYNSQTRIEVNRDRNLEIDGLKENKMQMLLLFAIFLRADWVVSGALP